MSPYVVAAIIGAAPATLSASALWYGYATRKDIKTNHGKRPGEYLEMIPQLAEDLASVATTLARHVENEHAHGQHDHPQRLVVVEA